MRVTITFQSDWHTGTGQGQPSGVDRLVARDHDELPFVNHKLFLGLLRDRAEHVADGLAATDGPVWHEWIEWLFGTNPAEGEPRPPTTVASTPRPAVVGLSAARIQPEAQDLLAARPRLKKSMTVIRPGVALEPGLRSAKEDYLRFIEMARAGVVYETDIQIAEHVTDDETLPEPAAALLACGLSELRRIGGKRRRGAGKCEVACDSLDVDAALDWLEGLGEQAAEIPAPPAAPETENPVAFTSVLATDLTPAARLTVTARGELLIHSETVGNVVMSRDCIPGSNLLPVISKRLRDAGFDLDPWIVGGHIAIRFATPQVAGSRSLPFPPNLLVEKGYERDDRTVHWNSFWPASGPDQPNGPLKARKQRWASTSQPGYLPETKRVSFVTRTHNTIEDELQTPTSAVGGVFTYQVVPAGSHFESEILVSGELRDALSEFPGWVDALAGEARVGRSRKDYGLVELTTRPSAPADEHAPIRPGEPFTVSLVSDCIVRNQTLGYEPTTTGLLRVLEKALGAELELRQASIRVGRTDSWNRRWQRPRPSLPALGAGSVLLVSANTEITSETITAAINQGVGERRAEGFGEITVDHWLHRLDHGSIAAPFSDTAIDPPSVAGDLEDHESIPAMRPVEEAAWIRTIEENALDFADDDDRLERRFGLGHGSMNRTQLGTIRDIAIQISKSDNDRQFVRNWLKHVEQSKPHRKRYPKALRAQLTKLLSDDAADTVWQLLDLSDSAESENNFLYLDEISANTSQRKQYQKAFRWDATAILLTAITSRLSADRQHQVRSGGDG